MKTVIPEEVFVSTTSDLFTWKRQGALVNKVGTVKWRCTHTHRLDSAAVKCAEKARRRWVRSGGR
jgi:hypothetical protein